MSRIPRDIQYAWRSLRRTPAFTAIAVLTLALGIGATTSVFTLVDGILISPLAVPEPDRLVTIEHAARDGQDLLPTSSSFARTAVAVS